MKRTKFSAFFIILILAVSFFILNIEVTTKQGINYKVSTLKIPLYLKILDFYDRHYNYKWLVHKIIEGKTTEEEKVMAILNWTIENIATQPKELRIVDDHVWHIIIRGYGGHDSFLDVFTTLCNYAGVKAFFMRFPNREHTSRYSFACVQINKKWFLFDPYHGSYFTREDGSLASANDIIKGEWEIKSVGGVKLTKTKAQLGEYFSEIPSIDFDESHKWSRANVQSPLQRFIYGIVKRKF